MINKKLWSFKKGAYIVILCICVLNIDYNHVLRTMGFGRVNLGKEYEIVYSNHRFPIIVYAFADTISDSLKYYGTWQEDVAQTLNYFIKPGMNIIHLGASIGYDDILITRFLKGKGNLYLYEPNPENLAILSKSFHLNGIKSNVTISKKAILDEFKIMDLCFNFSNVGGGTVSSQKGLEFDRCYKVETSTIDHDFKDLNRVDVVFMDIEGSEIKALQGAKNLLARSEGHVIIMEWNKFWLEKASDIQTFLTQSEKEGYKFWVIKKDEIKKIGIAQLNNFRFGDVVMTKIDMPQVISMKPVNIL